MKAFIDQDMCVGCAACENTCPEVFQMGSGKATVIQKPVAKENLAKAKEAASACPVAAITFE